MSPGLREREGLWLHARRIGGGLGGDLVTGSGGGGGMSGAVG
jgi:hypothetical protein